MVKVRRRAVRGISKSLLRPASAKSSSGKLPDCTPWGFASREVLNFGAWEKGTEGSCEILQGEEDALQRGLRILSQFLASRGWKPATLRAQLRSCFLLPGRGCLEGTRKPSSAWLWSLRLAEEHLPSSGLGTGAARGQRASCRVRGLDSQFLYTQDTEPKVITPSMC